MKPITCITITALASVMSVSSVLAQDDKPAVQSQQDIEAWAEMRAEAVAAGEILAGDVKNIASHVGRTEDLILNEKGTAVQYVLFESPFPYSFYSGEDGFVSFDAVDLDDDYYGGVNLVIKDADVSIPRDELTLTRGEARNRMVSRLVGGNIRFSDGEVREVEDMLIHPQSGVITHYVVEMDPDALFAEDLRIVRSKNVSIRNDGTIEANIGSDDVEAAQDYDQRFL